MSQNLQSMYSKANKGYQKEKQKTEVIERISKLPSGKVASRALRGRGVNKDEQSE